MSPFLFWIFALLTLIFGAAVVINRNPVASALSLVMSFLGLAALFISLNAYFIGIIQVLVYAGAVMVLFLFIIMLLDLRAEEARRINWLASACGVAVALILLGQIFSVINHLKFAQNPFPPTCANVRPAAVADSLIDTPSANNISRHRGTRTATRPLCWVNPISKTSSRWMTSASPIRHPTRPF